MKSDAMLAAAKNELEGIDLPELKRSLRKPRTFFSVFMSTLTTVLTIVAMIPLFSVVYMLLVRGGSKLSAACFTQLPPSAFEEGGGFGNAIVGTLLIVGIAALVLTIIAGLKANNGETYRYPMTLRLIS